MTVFNGDAIMLLKIWFDEGRLKISRTAQKNGGEKGRYYHHKTNKKKKN